MLICKNLHSKCSNKKIIKIMQKLLKNIIDHSIYANHIDYVHHSPYMHHDMDIKYTLTILQIPED